MDRDRKRRNDAIEWAENFELAQVKPCDRSLVQNVLVQVALFEDPQPDLSISVQPEDDQYTIVVKGFKQIMNDLKWVNIFMGKKRSENMASVIDLQTQPNSSSGSIVKFITVAGLKWEENAYDESHNIRRKRK